jgi:ABC-type multidrug transport system fused ATPase/permease subunit
MLTIVGPSGGGKSTLMKLLAGLYKPTAGEILYGGYEWMRYSSEDMGNAIGYVSQDYSAIRGTILDNISLLDPDISDEDLKWALKLACLNEVIDNTSHGLNTVLGSGGIGLSGGQLQRVAIARALIKRPKFLFLDEATSALDVLTEKKLMNQIKSEGITIVCIAHRLISAKISNQVIYLEAGNIVEGGSPQELIKSRDSRFSRLIEEERKQT